LVVLALQEKDVVQAARGSQKKGPMAPSLSLLRTWTGSGGRGRNQKSFKIRAKKTTTEDKRIKLENGAYH